MTFYKFAVFPVDEPTYSFITLPNAKYGSQRENGARIHAGCDLYVEDGSVVRAVADGLRITDLNYFYNGTYSVSIDHGNFVCRYGELEPYGDVKQIMSVSPVKAGDIIGYVKKTLKNNKKDYNPPMLHFELYSKSATGVLTVEKNLPTKRRSDLVDPTLSLMDCLSRHKIKLQLETEQKELAVRGKKTPLDLLINR